MKHNWQNNIQQSSEEKRQYKATSLLQR